MRDRSLYSDTHDPFGWIKTAGVVMALLAVFFLSAMSLARADSCAPSCRQRHNECRLQTKGAPQCDVQLQACVTNCMVERTPPRAPSNANAILPPQTPPRK